MKIKTFQGGYDHNFTYVVHDEKEAVIIDPAVPAEEVLEYVKGLEVKFIVIMHSHFDHLVDLEKYGKIPIYGHEAIKIKVDRKLKDGESIGFADVEFKVMHTPGHRYDCLCLLFGNNLFTSDTLFVEGSGRVDLPGSDPELMLKTLSRLKELPDDTVIYPGHNYGSTPTSTIGREKEKNRFFKMSREEFLIERS